MLDPSSQLVRPPAPPNRDPGRWWVLAATLPAAGAALAWFAFRDPSAQGVERRRA